MVPNTYDNGQDDSERKKRIDDLKRQADELAGGEMTSWKSDDLSPDIEEEFLQGVIAYESAPWTTHSCGELRYLLPRDIQMH
jgi:hypothetical protein